MAKYLLISNRNDLKQWLKIEKEKYGAHKIWPITRVFCEQDALYSYNWVLRHYEFYKNTGKKIRSLLFKLLHNRQEIKYHIFVPANACGCGLRFMHLGDILMNGNTRIGKNCSIHIGTRFVADGYTNKAPQLGDNVVVGVNSVLCGSIEIGDNIAIGASAFVNKSFEGGAPLLVSQLKLLVIVGEVHGERKGTN